MAVAAASWGARRLHISDAGEVIRILHENRGRMKDAAFSLDERLLPPPGWHTVATDAFVMQWVLELAKVHGLALV